MTSASVFTPSSLSGAGRWSCRGRRFRSMHVRLAYAGRVSIDAAAPGPLTVRTVEIPDPGDLIAALPEQGISWVRRGDGMVAWGEVARHDAVGAARMDEALLWWRRITRHAEVRDEVRARGTGLVAFGSFSFADDSPARRNAHRPPLRARPRRTDEASSPWSATPPPLPRASPMPSSAATPVRPCPRVTVDARRRGPLERRGRRGRGTHRRRRGRQGRARPGSRGAGRRPRRRALRAREPRVRLRHVLDVPRGRNDRRHPGTARARRPRTR